MTRQFRIASVDDLEALVALDGSVRGAAGAPASSGDWLGDDNAKWFVDCIGAGQCFVTTIDGQVAAYMVFHYHFFHDGFVDLLIVGAQHRRQGIAAAMLAEAEAMCVSEKLWTSTNLSNTPMQHLLAKAGYKTSGFIDDLDPGDPELIYSKRLRPPQAG